MSVTKQFIALMVVGAALMAAAMLSGAAPALFICLNAVCFTLLLADIILSPGGASLEIARAGENTLYYQAENKLEIIVRNTTNRPLHVTLTDDLPDWHFTQTAENLTHIILPKSEQAFDYCVVPAKRGSFMFHRVHARVRGRLGLCDKFFTYPAPAEMKVYPNLRDLSKYRLIMRKDRLLQSGGRRVPVRGAGSEFESLREYVEGDDFRKINWNSTAREHKLIVNQFEAEKNQPVFILIDAGRTLSCGSHGFKKLDFAINAALILSDIVNQKGDNSGLMVFDTEPRGIIMPGKGERHRNALMEALYHIEDTKNASDYEGAFIELSSRQKRRCLAFIFTDFSSVEEAKMLLESVGVLTRRHVPVVVLMENEGVRAISAGKDDTLATVYEKAVALEFLRERERVMRAFAARGVMCVESAAERFALTAVNSYLNIKNRNVI